MSKICFLLTIGAILLGESWILFGERDGTKLVAFMDGKTHGVCLWWFIRNLSDILIVCVAFFCAAIGWMEKDKRMAFFFWIIFVYFDFNLMAWIYNYSTNRYIFFAMITAVIIWSGWKCWPSKFKMKIV